MEYLEKRETVCSDTEAVHRVDIKEDNPAFCAEENSTLQLWGAIEVD